MLVLLGVLSHHGIGVVVILIDDAVAIGVLVGVHNVLHVEGDILSQPVVDDQELLGVGHSAGLLDQIQDLVTGGLDGVAVVLDTQLISVVEVGDHTGQVVKGDSTCTDSVDRNVGHSQHFAQDAQAVFAVVIVLQEEGSLNAQQVGVGFPLIQVLLEQVQNLLLLLFGETGRGAVSIQNLQIIQFLGYCDDGGIFLVHFHAVSLQQIDVLDCGQVEGLVGCCGCGVLGGQSCQGCCAQNHGQNDQHAQQSHCNLLH